MGSIIKACNLTNNVRNTGKECDTAMVATAMLIALQPGLKFTELDLEDPVVWMQRLIQEKKAFPIFGQKAPIRTINNSSEGDQIITLDDGVQVFLRYGVYNRMFETTSGGLCYAQALGSFLNSGYDILEIDQSGQMMARKNPDGTFGGLITSFMYSPSPIMADFKSTPYKNRFQISYSPTEVVNNGIIFKGAEGFLSLMGLIDTIFTLAEPATTTEIAVGIVTECAEADLVAKYGINIAKSAIFSVREADGTTIVVTTALNGNTVVLTGAFPTGENVTVEGTTPEVWGEQVPPIEGYDGSFKLTVAIP